MAGKSDDRYRIGEKKGDGDQYERLREITSNVAR